jgi:hypothetical protein
MSHLCSGSGRELTGDPPPNTAASCPVCGRGVRVDGHDTERGMTFSVGPHEEIVRSS